MRTLARRTYIAGSLTCIFIGLLHTYVHAKSLSGDELKARFDAMGAIDVDGTITSSWDLFQGLSLLMGFLIIALGVANLIALRLTADNRPAVATCITMLAMLTSIIVIGALYLGPMQFYGGMAGLVMFGLPIVDRLRDPA